MAPAITQDDTMGHARPHPVVELAAWAAELAVVFAAAIAAGAIWWSMPLEWLLLGRPVIVRRLFRGAEHEIDIIQEWRS